MYQKKRVIKIWSVIFLVAVFFSSAVCSIKTIMPVKAMPFYDLQPKDIVKRASFYTS